ncbi:MAG: FtsW/RodA/SpoVE family cell cycle protein [Tannerella sp.]|jgi:cell division protein FtsW|nr:FtsW/RodA/SpoVE family cell cycle protein [Tannerella sp.]
MAGKDIVRKLFQGDRVVWVIFLLLCGISIIEVFSATSTLAYKSSNIYVPIIKHVTILSAGFLFTLGLCHVQYKLFSVGIVLMPLSLILLFVTLIIGLAIHGAPRWFFGFQPSELAKLACIIYVAFLLSRRVKLSDNKTYNFILFGIVPICALILYANLSTAVLLGFVCFLMMIIGQIPFKKLGKLVFQCSVILVVAVLTLCVIPQDVTKKYLPRARTWQSRVEKFIGPKLDSENTSADKKKKTYEIDPRSQETYAKIAIAKGGVFGRLPGRSIQRDFLSQAYSDFIFAIIIEELGVVGGMFVLLLYVILMFRVGIIAKRCGKLFPKYLVLGCGLMIVIQAITHMAVTVGLFPVTGQPLPLISKGGTSLIVTCIYMGIILSVSHYSAEMSEKDEEENDEINEAIEELERDDLEENSEKNPIFAVETTEIEKR